MNAAERKPRIPNAAKILHAYMQCCGVTDSYELAEQLGIPVRTIQHLKREAAQLSDAKSAKACAQTAQDIAPTQRVAPQETQRVALDDAKGCAKTQDVAPLARAYSKITNNYTDTGTSNVTALQPLRDLHEQLMDALGPAANPVSMGLMIVGEVQSWIDQGADRDLDVLDVIRAKARTMAAGSVNGWGYFRQPVAEAKARRERGLPSVPAPAYEQRKRLTAAEYMAEQRKLAEAAR